MCHSNKKMKERKAAPYSYFDNFCFLNIEHSEIFIVFNNKLIILMELLNGHKKNKLIYRKKDRQNLL